MDIINTLDLIRIKQSILRKIDKEIVNHGIETAYIVCMLAHELGYSKDEIYHLAIISCMHDIGAYKTEELNKIKQFEVVETTKHSIYGYVIFNSNSITKHMASSILYHHHSYENKNNHICEIETSNLAFLIGLADRISILCNLLNYDEEKITNYIYTMNKDFFDPKYIDILYRLIESKGLINKIVSGKYTKHLLQLIKNKKLDMKLIEEYLLFLPVSIDFFSFETSLHTVSVSSVAKKICDHMKIDKEYKEKIEIGAYLHDLGKVCIPKHILEKEDKLTKEEFEIMKKHVSYTREILEDARIDKELINLACNHHEKLDGSGYSKGLNENDLSLGDRIISISDIFCALTENRHYKKSFSKDKVLEILCNMVESNYIDKEIVDVVCINYDEFLEFVSQNRKVYQQSLENMAIEYNDIITKMDNL
jgi:putative nucleotidyltransferase with HDIG domain